MLGYQYVRLDNDGRIVERAAGYKAPGRIGNKGLEIDFRTDADGSLHKLDHFSVNLSDERLRENKPFLAFLSGLKGMTTFFKATSYMPHHKGFTIIRDEVLDQSAAVLQDDSGIPYRFFDAARWQVQLYGDYERPYGSFKWLEQPDLRKALPHVGHKTSGLPHRLRILAGPVQPAAGQAQRDAGGEVKRRFSPRRLSSSGQHLFAGPEAGLQVLALAFRGLPAGRRRNIGGLLWSAFLASARKRANSQAFTLLIPRPKRQVSVRILNSRGRLRR